MRLKFGHPTNAQFPFGFRPKPLQQGHAQEMTTPAASDGVVFGWLLQHGGRFLSSGPPKSEKDP